MNLRHFILALAVALASVSTAHAQANAAKDDGFPALSKAIAKFQKKRELASEKVVKAFEQAIRVTENDRSLSEAAKTARMDEIEQAKKNFVARGSLPTDDLLISISIAYLDSLYKREVPFVRRQFERARDEDADDLVKLEKINAAERRWLESFPTRAGYEKNGDWHGRRIYKSGSTIDCNLHIRKFEDGVVGGSIWWNNRSTSQQGLAAEGRYYGNLIVLETVKTLKGGPHSHAMQGYHIGGRILLKVHKPSGTYLSSLDFHLKKSW